MSPIYRCGRSRRSIYIYRSSYVDSRGQGGQHDYATIQEIEPIHPNRAGAAYQRLHDSTGTDIDKCRDSATTHGNFATICHIDTADSAADVHTSTDRAFDDTNHCPTYGHASTGRAFGNTDCAPCN